MLICVYQKLYQKQKTCIPKKRRLRCRTLQFFYSFQNRHDPRCLHVPPEDFVVQYAYHILHNRSIRLDRIRVGLVGDFILPWRFRTPAFASVPNRVQLHSVRARNVQFPILLLVQHGIATHGGLWTQITYGRMSGSDFCERVAMYLRYGH